MVVMMMVMVMVMVIPLMPIPGNNDSWAVIPVIAVVVVVMMMMVVLYKKLSRFHPWSALGLIDSLQLFHGIRNRF
jgi:membrane protein YdbS with pleckstrin-like domain